MSIDRCYRTVAGMLMWWIVMDMRVREFFFGYTELPMGRCDGAARPHGPASRLKLIDDVLRDVDAGHPVTTIYGEAGIGKTVLASEVGKRLQGNHRLVIQLAGSSCNPLLVQKLIARAACLREPGPPDPGQLLVLLRRVAAGKSVVLVVDDAHRMSAATFRYLSFMIDLFKFSEIRFSVVLFGALGERWSGLDQPFVERLSRQTAILRIILPLPGDEATSYLEHRVQCVGGSLQRLMTRDAVAELIDYADGIPAALNAAAENVMLHAFRKRRRRIGASVVRRALRTDPEAGPAFHPRRLPGRLMAIVFATMAVVPCGGFLAWQAWTSSGMPGPQVATIPTELSRSNDVATPIALQPAQPPAGQSASLPPAPLVGQVPALSQPDVGPVTPGPSVPLPAVAASESSVALGTSVISPAPTARPAAEPAEQSSAEIAIAPGHEIIATPTEPTKTREPIATAGSATILSHQVAPQRPLGLVILAQPGDTLRLLYSQLYRGVTPPPYEYFAAANRAPIRPGAMIIVPEPPEGWPHSGDQGPRVTAD